VAGQRFCGNCGKQKEDKLKGNPFGGASGSFFAATNPANDTCSRIGDSCSPVSGGLLSDMDDKHPSAASNDGLRGGCEESGSSDIVRKRRARWWNPTTWRNKSRAGQMDKISEEVTEILSFDISDDSLRCSARSVDDKVQST